MNLSSITNNVPSRYGLGVVALTQTEFGSQVNLREIATLECSKDDQRIEQEIADVGAALGGGFYNTSESHVMKFKEAMKKDPV